MAFSTGRPDRPESLIFRSQQSPREESPFPTFTSPLSPLRTLSSRVNSSLIAAEDARGNLQRRFTTNALPTLSPLGQQRRAAAEPKDYISMTCTKIAPTEKKAREYEQLLAQQRRIQAQMEMFDPETRREVEDAQRLLTQDITRFTSGHQSEPTTPPEHHGSLHRPAFNRFSSATLTSASLVSPPGIHVRPHRSGSQLTSPPTAFARPYSSHTSSNLPSKSVPASRRGSDEEKEDLAYGFPDISHRAAANLNRNSMPVKMADLSSMLGSVNTASFLFGDEDEHKAVGQVKAKTTSSPDAKTYLQLHHNEDKFPILVRSEDDGNTQLAASSADQENHPKTDRATATRHRQSLPPSAMRQTGYTVGEGAKSPLNGILTDLHTAKNTAANRRSLEVKFSGIGETKRPSLLASPKNGTANGFPKLQSSYSTNDIPTLKSTNAVAYPSDSKPAFIQSPRHDFASPDRQSVVTLNHLGIHGNRQSQDIGESTKLDEQNGASYLAQRSALQASAAPFGPPVTAADHEVGNHTGAVASPSMPPYGAPPYYAGYGMQMLNSGFNNMYLGHAPSPQWAGGQVGQMPPQVGQMPVYQGAYGGGYPPYTQPTGNQRFPDSQPRAIQHRRAQNGEENTRFTNVKLESLAGEIYGLCKDQHGCRYLQKKLEDRDPEHIQMIFEETAPHVMELMTDPFGNYLCQKLLEYTNDDQRTILISNAAPKMVTIALNQHGTRALQKMIEFISTREQIQIIIDALKFEVVHLIQDLNGNHVIQKCLNHLTPEDAQFIFSAVGTHCIVVGTHRHGCCVLQRCIDHASGVQKGQLIEHITANAFSLVQDPFGNYVVQYILDLGERAFSEPLCKGFLGNVALLSKQKFSSNVIEKCIRTADGDTKRALIEEIMNPMELEKLLRDSFANYVVQTAFDYAAEEDKARLVESIRPIIPAIRHTPYGRRLQGKIQDYDSRLGLVGNGTMSPSAAMSPAQLSGGPFSRTGGGSHLNGYGSPNSTFSNASNYAFGPGSPPPQYSNGTGMNAMGQANQTGPGPAHRFPLGRAARPAGVSDF